MTIHNLNQESISEIEIVGLEYTQLSHVSFRKVLEREVLLVVTS
jgi:hypothetical protein